MSLIDIKHIALYEANVDEHSLYCTWSLDGVWRDEDEEEASPKIARALELVKAAMEEDVFAQVSKSPGYPG